MLIPFYLPKLNMLNHRYSFIFLELESIEESSPFEIDKIDYSNMVEYINTVKRT